MHQTASRFAKCCARIKCYFGMQPQGDYENLVLRGRGRGQARTITRRDLKSFILPTFIIDI
jgi:hypothetical protein